MTMKIILNKNAALINLFKFRPEISNISIAKYSLLLCKTDKNWVSLKNTQHPSVTQYLNLRNYCQLRNYSPCSNKQKKVNYYVTTRNLISHEHSAFVSRSYSQNAFNNRTSSRKWLLIVLSSGLAGAAVYKVFFGDELTPSKDITQENHQNGKSGVKEKIFKVPADSNDIPDNVPYLLIGGGTAAFSAFRAIKAFDPTARVLMITNEVYYPYMRPPLTKELIHNEDRGAAKQLSFTQWDGSERSVFFEPKEFYLPCEELNQSETGGVCVARGWEVTELNPELKYVILDDGKRITYNKCLLATGAVPKNLPLFANSDVAIQEKVTLYRNLHDFIQLENAIENGARSIAVVGGGFTGSELACSLARRGIKVFQIFKEGSNMAHVLPEYLSEWVTSKIEKQGVIILRNSEVERVALADNKISLTMKNQEAVVADHVIVATGATPNTNLAASASLEVDSVLGGYLVNTELEARRDLFAAGDCACFYDQHLGRRRIEHHDHAVISGRLAGENMTGARKPFAHQSMFWSDLGPELGYEAIGIVDSSLPTVAVYLQKEYESDEKKDEELDESMEKKSSYLYSESPPDDFQKGVVFYLKNEKVVGMVMWNIFNRISIARQVLKSNIGLSELREVAKLFHLNKTAAE